MDGDNDHHHHAAVVSENDFLRRLRSLRSPATIKGSTLRVINCLGFTLLICFFVFGISACRSTKSPEELSTDAGDFVGKVIYNSAGAQSNEQLSQGYGVDCTACGGLGYYAQKDSDTLSTRQPCPSCQGKGWRTP
jgi:hypothetical protein